MTITGHSLGGYLGQVFQRIFGSAGTYTYNALGVVRPDAPIFDQLTSLLGLPPGSFGSGAGENLLVPGEPAQLIGTVQGKAQIQIFSETESETIFSIDTISAHKMGPVTDSLALYSLFATLDPTLNTADPADGIGKITSILKAASADPAKSLEATLDKLRTLFEQDYVYGNAHYTADPTLDWAGAIGRDDYYTNLYALQETLKSQPFTTFNIETLAGKSSAELVQLAQTDPAYRYALLKLNPFAVTGASALYDAINAEGELDLYNPVTGQGELSAQYLKDRAAFLADLIVVNTVDQTEGGSPWLNTTGNSQYFEDNSGYAQTKLFLGADKSITTQPVGELTQIKFGGWLDDTLAGGGKADHLYGGAGNDTLTGNGGNDYLEGGQGNDTYVINPGDGDDTILDTDGLGVIKFGAIAATGSASIADGKNWIQVGNLWTDRQNGLTYRLVSQANGTQDLYISSGSGSVRVKDWSDGELGIALGVNTAVPPPVIDLTIVGDLQPIDFNLTEAGVQTQTDYLGNIIVSGEAAPGREDVLYGSGGNDLIQGLGGNDYIDARSGDDRIEGGAGQDLLIGGAGNDTVLGGVDSDVVAGAADDDRLFAEAEYTIDEAYTLGETQAASGQRGDLLDGGIGDDILIGEAGNDILLGGMGKDILMGMGGDDTIEGDANVESANRNWGVTRTVTNVEGNTLYSRSYDFSTAGTDGGVVGDSDVIYGGAGNDWIFAKGGNDFVDGGADDDVVFGGAGNDIILGQAGNDVLIGDDLSPNLDASHYGDDYLSGGAGNDKLWGSGGSDYLEGGDDNDVLVGDGKDVPGEYHGDDVLDGGEGDDQLFGGGGNDTLIGGAGADQLYGGADNDTYLGVGAGDVIGDLEGHSTIVLADANSVSTDILPSVTSTPDSTLRISLDNGATLDLQGALYGMDASIQFANGEAIDLETWVSENLTQSVKLNLSDIQLDSGGTVTRAYGGAGADQIQAGAGNDAIMGYGGDDVILGMGGNDVLDGGAGNDHLQGGDGSDTLLGGTGNDELQGGLGDDALEGGSGDDLLFGQEGNDTLEGGAGNDVLAGNAGADVYLFSLGDGQDVIWEEGDSAGDVLRFGEGIAAADITVSKTGYGLVLSHTNGVDQVTIANWYAAESYRLTGFEFSDGTVWGGVDTGNLGLLNLRGTAGDDAIYGDSLNESLDGLEGNDQLYGNNGNDFLVGGKGNDLLAGGSGSDTYLFALGDGVDVINGDNTDTLRFGPDILTTDIVSERVGYDLLLQHKNGTDGVRIANWYSNTYYQLQQVVFDSDGTTWSAAQLSQMGVNIDHQHTLNLGDNTKVIEDWGGVDSITFGDGIGEGDISISRTGQDLSFSHVNGSDSVTIKDWFNDVTKQIETIQFSMTGTVLTTEQLVTPFLTLTGSSANDEIAGGNVYGETIFGLNGNDTLFGGGGDDHIIGGQGNDTLSGGLGSDTYYFNLGDGYDTIYDSSGGNTLIFGPGLLGSLSVTETVWRDIVYSFGAGDTVFVSAGSFVAAKFVDNGTMAADTLNGSAYGDLIHGLEGNDVIYGDNGADVLYGDAGNDTIVGGAGSDWLYGGDGDDTLDGYSLTGTADYEIYGSDNKDHYVGGKGNDTLYGNSRDDYYYFNLGDGNDIITEGKYYGNGQWFYSYDDRLIFGSGITIGGIQVNKLNSDLLVLVSDTDSIIIKNWFSDSMGRIDSFRFADGSYLTATDITQLAFTVHGTPGDDFLSGDPNYGNVLYGEAGNDTLNGGSGTDALHGGAGDDLLNGNSGNDEYFFERGGGRDTIYDSGGTDTVRFDASINAADLSLSRTGNDLVLSLTGTNDALAIRGYFNGDLYYYTYNNSNDVQYGNRNLIESFVFADGSQLPSISAIFDSFLNIRGAGGNDELAGTSWADVIYGGEGDDVLLGVGSYDVLYGDAGNDYLTGGLGSLLYGGVGDDVMVGGAYSYMQGGSGNDSYYACGGAVLDTEGTDDKIVFYAGTSLTDLYFQKLGNNLAISVAGGESVNIYNQFLNDAFKVERLEFADGSTLGLRDIQFGTGSALTGTAEDSILIGYGTNDSLNGGDGNDWLYGAYGSDTMAGGTGNDLYFVDDRQDVVLELSDQGLDTVSSTITYTLGANVENLVLAGTDRINGTGNALDNVLTGNSAANTLTGGAGNDWLDGKGGADKMVGGLGDDTYVVDTSTDGITERSNEGTDLALANVTFTLANYVENLTLTGTAAIDGSGNALDNVLTGNRADNNLDGAAGNDTLDGMGGTDLLMGGKGNDTYIMDRGYGTDTVVENDATAGNTDIAQFLSGIAADQIWFSKDANDLEVSIIGTADTLVIKDWYLGTAYHVEQFKTADGMTLFDSQVDNLVNAMASFSPPAAGQTTLPSTYQPILYPVIAASWQ